MSTKYKCKRCGNIAAIKMPNCPECSSCDGYETTEEKTKTVFRIWPDGEVIALFPQIAASVDGHLCQDYVQVGQHGAADTLIVVRRTRSAKPKEYQPLLKELRQIGYNPQIAKRCTYRDFQIRQKQYAEVK